MQLSYVIPYVENVAETLAFFERAFGLKRKFLHEAGDYGELDTGATTLSFSSLALMRELGKNPSASDAKAPVYEVALTTDDVPAAFARAVDAGAVAVQEPTEMPWGQTISYVSDPNGILIEICTPIGG